MKSNPPIPVGQLVAGKYRLLKVIGEGGMGVVYLAEHELIEKRVALKVLRPEYSSRPELVSRFQQEAISASRIKHPNVLDVFDFGQLEDGSFFLAMEYLQGHDLSHELQGATMQPARALRVALQTTRALAAAHGRGVVHRDMKPENVFLHMTEDGDEIVKIVDFGIAQLKSEDREGEEPKRRRLTRTGMIFGTPEYMSPEQAAGRPVDLRVDIYALGVILYEMFTGAVPFTSDSFMAVLSAHMTRPVPPMRSVAPDLGISEELEAVIYRALEKDPQRRFQSMKELAGAIQLTPEGRSASTVSGALAIPDVNPTTFRPVRAAGASTSPQFDPSAGSPPVSAVSGRGGDSGEYGPSVQTLAGANTNGTVVVAEPRVSLNPTTPAAPAKWLVWLLVLGFIGMSGVVVVGVIFGGRSLIGRISGGGVSVAPERPPSATASTAAPPSPSPSSLPPPTASPLASVADVPGVPSAVPDAPAGNAVTITINTTPSGAVVTKDGFQVCDTTPCTTTVDRGAAFELVAVKGALRGSARVLGQKDQTVTIAMAGARVGGGGGRTPQSQPQPTTPQSSPGQLCEVMVNGLKILRACK